MTRQLAITQPFDLELSLTMGQAFRWRSLGDGWLSGVLGENLFHIRQRHINGNVEYRVGGEDGERDATDADNELLLRYFREDDKIEAIYADLCRRDRNMVKLIEDYRGMRVLRQDPWECLVSYICSRSNRIPSIRQCVAEIATLSCQTVKLDGDEQHVFPTPKQLVAAGVEGLIELNLMGRFSRDFPSAIYAAARRVRNGELDFDELKQQPYSDVMYRLMQGPRYGHKEANGIGIKIADCVALMSLEKLEAFPVDTHISNVVLEYYPTAPKTSAAIVTWAQNRFGPYAGYAGQYLFYAWRQQQQASQKPPASANREHLSRNCPQCGELAGKHCKTPGGYYHLQGHTDRRT